MQDSTRNQLTRSMLALVVIAGPTACDSGYKQIGALDDGSGATETNEGGDPGDGDPGDGDMEEMGETGEACTGDGDPEAEVECAEPQEVDADWTVMPGLEEDALWTCAANVEAQVGGYNVVLTHCTDSQDQPQPDTLISLLGDWPEPELADGDQPLTQFRFFADPNPADPDHKTTWVALRSVGQERIALFAFKGGEPIISPTWLSPLVIQLDGAGCVPDTITCSAQTQHQEYRAGFRVGYGCSEAIVADDTMITDFGIDENAGTVYDVLVGFAKIHECEPDGDFNELELGVVGRTP